MDIMQKLESARARLAELTCDAHIAELEAKVLAFRNELFGAEEAEIAKLNRTVELVTELLALDGEELREEAPVVEEAVVEEAVAEETHEEVVAEEAVAEEPAVVEESSVAEQAPVEEPHKEKKEFNFFRKI